MASVTVLFVVLTLTGEPVVNALCIAWCDISSETMNCGEAIAYTTVPEFTAGAGTVCATVLPIAPFLREEGRDRGRLAIVATVAVSVLPPDEACPAPVQKTRAAADGRSAPPLVLRI